MGPGASIHEAASLPILVVSGLPTVVYVVLVAVTALTAIRTNDKDRREEAFKVLRMLLPGGRRRKQAATMERLTFCAVGVLASPR
ncbi:hypothetical protein ACFORO_41435 [Amycolatopsis halotolerans]|uniref:Uncharacterized protein n=1 Tax=Amycolatopsis halotolerans TaxID=330083 RepID=A0ABV7QUE8_9PSEU